MLIFIGKGKCKIIFLYLYKFVVYLMIYFFFLFKKKGRESRLFENYNFIFKNYWKKICMLGWNKERILLIIIDNKTLEWFDKYEKWEFEFYVMYYVFVF